MLACLLAFLLNWLPAPVSASSLPDTTRASVSSDSTLRAQCPGYTRVRVEQVLFVGNIKTKERILRAELDFREGDSLDVAELGRRLEANRRRIYNLQLFHEVALQMVCRDGSITVLFGMQERWYTFPVPIFSLADRNFRSWANRPDRWRRVDYGIHLTRNNFRGRNEQLIANLQLGFNRKYEVFYEAPGYGKRRRLGLGLAASYYQSRALDYATVQDRLVNYRTDNGFALERQYFLAGLRWRHTVQRLSAFDISYHHERVAPEVTQLNPNYYLGSNCRDYLDFTFSTTLNQRNTFAYPLTGRFVQVVASQRVFLRTGSPGITTLYGTYARYLALGRGFYYSVGVQARARFAQRIAYPDNHAFGYEALVRGYDAYVVDGRYYGLARQGVSYRLLDLGRLRLNSIGNPKVNSIPLVFYLNTFTDAGYVLGRSAVAERFQNRLPNQILASAGVGLHLVTYYDWVFTAEYALNGRGETGFFFRTSFPI
ncbi:hypothetical protein H8B15_04680 [Hymenobacter sp. BT507]|uniref:POTRA domain-containing protein n=1 Tax=Hymenobacter citatus TaxID=2763506 RepID=A0ABR7MGI7_9BACT|nr:POTRA domain-containing protein [Hymenobacter citatus]MBC6610201.1 hypothetical protein [Hymenobacter citatus]